MFSRQSVNVNDHPRVITYINTRLFQLQFLLRKNIINYRDINLISFFDCGITCFIINIYWDDQKTALKYLKNIEVNLNNILIMTEDFDIRDNDWNPLYPHCYDWYLMNATWTRIKGNDDTISCTVVVSVSTSCCRCYILASSSCLYDLFASCTMNYFFMAHLYI